MSGFELNKIFGAFLGALLLIVSLSHIAGAILHVEEPEKRGFEVAGVESDTSGAATVKQELQSIIPLLTSADIEAGKKVAKKCLACHVFEKGGPHKLGPNMWDIVNRNQASFPDFAYSKALKELTGTWDYDALNKYLYKPKKYAPGTKMNFVGLKKEKDRANIIAYLRSLSEKPADIPAVEEPAAEEAPVAEETNATEPATEETTQ